ncbi:MAG: hypothetical protein K0Q72_2603, partial [Armatimonadetes bacterium]|nr:hypothetical protein [Armatimonadota bacterium]
MNGRWWAAGAALFAAAPAAHGQTAATVRSVVRVVKAGRVNTQTLFDAKVGTTLATGDRIRTAGRSAAGLRMGDQSQLRLGELTEVVMTGNRARVLRGQVVADFKRPGTISSDYAVAAVRGTIVDFTVNEEAKEAEIRCYDGRVFVSSADNPVEAGTSAAVTATQITDPALQGASTNWAGAQIRFVDGPYAGETRSITGFAPGTGTVTFTPALAAAAAGPSGYLLVTRPDRDVVELRNNMGTTVPQGRSPSRPYNVPAKEFARLKENPPLRQLEDGRNVFVFPGTEGIEEQRRQDFAARDAIDRTSTSPRRRFCGPGTASHGGPHDDVCRIAGVRASVAREFAQATPPSPPTREQRVLPTNVLPELEGGENRNVVFRFEPFAIGSDEQEALGARLRIQSVSGNVYAEAGYRFTLVGGETRHDVSEAFLHVRGRYGDVIAGRQHLYPGPGNNTRIGTLLGLETTDAVVYEAPLRRGYKQQVGYLFDTQALRREGVKGAYARGKAPLARGYAG